MGDKFIEIINGKKILQIRENLINKSHFEKVEDFDKSIFSQVYYQAYDCLIDIVNGQKSCEKSGYSYQEEGIKPRNFDLNNIIAFVGDRGCGKTSCMKNFRRSLKEGIGYVEKFHSGMGEKDIKDVRFELLSVIDPSLFSVKDSIIEIIVAQMFNRFRDRIKECSGDNDDKQKIIGEFEKVYKDIRVINSNKEHIYDTNYDSLESLISLSSAVALKEDMSSLVKEYIKFMSKNKDEDHGYLIISIDDIDMSLSVGEKMLEDIRKYLIIPNVIILMAVNMEQLEDIVLQRSISYLKENEILYKELNQIKNTVSGSEEGEKKNNKKEDETRYGLEIFMNRVSLRSKNYLEKIIPFNRRIFIENLNLDKMNVKLTNGSKESIKNFVKDKVSESICDGSIDILSNKPSDREFETYCKNLLSTNLRLFTELVNLINNLDANMKEENYKKIDNFYEYIMDIRKCKEGKCKK